MEIKSKNWRCFQGKPLAVPLQKKQLANLNVDQLIDLLWAFRGRRGLKAALLDILDGAE